MGFGRHQQRVRVLIEKLGECRFQLVEISSPDGAKQNVQPIGGSFCFAHARRHTGIRGIPRSAKREIFGEQCAKDIEALGTQVGRHQRAAGYISAGPGEALDQSDPDRIAVGAENDGDGLGGFRGGKAGRRADGHDATSTCRRTQVCRKLLQTRDISLCKFAFNRRGSFLRHSRALQVCA